MKKSFILPDSLRENLKQVFEQKAQADQQAQQAQQAAAQAHAQQNELNGKIQGILSAAASFAGIDINQGLELDPNLAFISGYKIEQKPGTQEKAGEPESEPMDVEPDRPNIPE